MVPYNYTEFIDEINSQIKSNLIPMSRIDDAVKRILRVKFTMGLFEEPLADLTFANQLGSKVRCSLYPPYISMELNKSTFEILYRNTGS